MKLSLQEAKVFKELVVSDTSKGLVHVFFAQRATSKVLEEMRVPPPLRLFCCFFQFRSYQICVILACSQMALYTRFL